MLAAGDFPQMEYSPVGRSGGPELASAERPRTELRFVASPWLSGMAVYHVALRVEPHPWHQERVGQDIHPRHLSRFLGRISTQRASGSRRASDTSALRGVRNPCLAPRSSFSY